MIVVYWHLIAWVYYTLQECLSPRRMQGFHCTFLDHSKPLREKAMFFLPCTVDPNREVWHNPAYQIL